jgi:hypothetical protein
VDTNELGIGWGEYVRVRTKINITKPLARGRLLKMKDRSYWIRFQYEKIPKFCYRCGIICHEADGCKLKEKGRLHVDGTENGPWLCANSPRRGPNRRRGPGVGGNPSWDDSRSNRPGRFQSPDDQSNRSNGRSSREETSSANSGEIKSHVSEK